MGTHLFSHHKLALTDSAHWESNTFITRKSTVGLFDSSSPSPATTTASILGDFKYATNEHDNKFVDYFLSLAVALAIVTSAHPYVQFELSDFCAFMNNTPIGSQNNSYG